MKSSVNLLARLLSGGVEVCFCHSKIPELCWLSTLNDGGGVRCIPCLSEAIASDAASGYAHMARRFAPVLKKSAEFSNDIEGLDRRRAGTRPSTVPSGRVSEAVMRLKSGAKCMIVIGGSEVDIQRGLMLSRIGKACGARVGIDGFSIRVARGAGSAVLEKLPCQSQALFDCLRQLDQLILISADPMAFCFADSQLSGSSISAPETCEEFRLAEQGDDIDQLLEDLLEQLDAVDAEPKVYPLNIPVRPSGSPNMNSVALTLARHLPENAILVGEAIAFDATLAKWTRTAQPHDYLSPAGYTSGCGLPAALGAAVACPGRKVVCLEGAGGVMSSLQVLWTLVRENLDITVLLLNNRSAGQLQTDTINTDFVAIAKGFGVPACRATTVEDFNSHLQPALQACGPRLLEVVL